MGLDVGLLYSLENDSEGDEMLREYLEDINAVLADHRLPPLREPDSLHEVNARNADVHFRYSFLHYLRRVAAHAAEKPGWVVQKPFPESSDPTSDPLLKKHSSYLHLLCHSDCEGYYVPIQFNEVIYDSRIAGGWLGSSYVLQKELIAVAPALAIRLENRQLSDQEADRINHDVEALSPLWIEMAVWITLFEAARLSILHKAAIRFG